MYTIALNDDGDMDFSNRHGRVITGRKKLVQQLGMWVREELHVDRFHYDYGSNLINMIGAPQSEQLQTAVENEIRRVIMAYMKMQSEDFDKHPQDYSKDEVLASLLFIASEWRDTTWGGKALHCTVWVRTMANDTVTLEYDVE